VKLGRNQPCWCGSGMKFKKCHLNRQADEPVNKEEIYKQLNNFYGHKVCSAPDSLKNECTDKIIKAHSVSKSSSLKEISKEGHVLTTFKCLTTSENNLKIEPKKIGINKASTFTGFCSFHDKSLFSPIEDEEFEITKLNCFLVAYRSVARELFVKNRVSSTLNFIKNTDKGKNIHDQKYIQSRHKYLNTNNDLTTSDLKHIKSEFDRCFQSNEFSAIHHLVFTLNEAPKVMASAVVGPTLDFQGNKLQTFSEDPNQIPDYLMINVFSSSGTGYILLSWLETQKNSCVYLCKSLLRTESPADSLTIFIFAMIENIYFSEDWWFNLTETDREMLMNIFSQGVTEPTYNDVLITDKLLNAFNIIDATSLGFNKNNL